MTTYPMAGYTYFRWATQLGVCAVLSQPTDSTYSHLSVVLPGKGFSVRTRRGRVPLLFYNCERS